MNIEVKSQSTIILSAVVALAISGCAPKQSCCKEKSAPAAKKVTTTPAKSDYNDKQIAALKAAIKEAKNRTIVKEVAGKDALFPPNKVPGKCYARVLTPAKYDLVTEKVLAQDASERLQVIPAKYKWVSKKVLIKEASEKIVPVAPTYKTMKVKVRVSEAGEKIISVPAVYTTVKEKILVSKAHTAWRKGRGPIEKMDNATCEILCLVNIPAKYKIVTKKVLKTPATTKVVPVPAVYKTVEKRILATPATTKIVTIPAQYKTIRVKELLKEAVVKRTTIPEQYRSVKRKVKVSDATLKWQEIACKKNMTQTNIRSLQKQLKHAGFNPGPIDGIMGWRTKSALHKFQKSNGLSTGALTQETLTALKA